MQLSHALRLAALALVLFPFAVLAVQPPIDARLSADAIGFDVSIPYGAADLVLQGPDGVRVQRQFSAEDPLQLDLRHGGEILPDGVYTYELRLTAPTTRLRGEADTSAALTPMPVLSGHLRIEGGLAVTRTASDGADAQRQQRENPTASGPEIQTEADQVFIDDVIMTGGLCVGSSCVNGETFGSDTLRLKEVNLRIHFQDTSLSPFPTNDWRIIANDDGSGGAGYLAIEDTDNSYKPFTIMAGSRANALYVDSNDYVGIGTATPAQMVHMVSGDTPTLRLHQDASSSFMPQVWDLGGNEANFFVRDNDTNNYPFRIDADAPNHALAVSDGGEIGFGTATPSADLHMIRSGVPVDITLADSSSGRNWSMRMSGSGFAIARANDASTFLAFDDGRVRMGPDGTENFLLATNGNLTIAGNLTELSDVNAKHQFQEVDTAAILDGLLQLPLSTWSYRDDPASVRHLGPTAQEFEKIFGLGNGDPTRISGMDVRGVALAAIQELARRSEVKNSEIDNLREDIEKLQALNEALLQRLEALEAN